MQTVPSGFAIVFPEVLAVEYGYIRVSSKEQNKDNDLTGTFVADLVLQILSQSGNSSTKDRQRA